jgi:hypothetical protein
MPLNEADTCRRYVVPGLQAAGWDTEPHRLNEQVTFTDGRILVAGRSGHRRPGKRADYILRYRPDVAIAVVEAKPSYATPGQGLQQAKAYAEILGLKFAYATNGHGIVEFDYLAGREREIETFPTPEELWRRLTVAESLDPEITDRLKLHGFGQELDQGDRAAAVSECRPWRRCAARWVIKPSIACQSYGVDSLATAWSSCSSARIRASRLAISARTRSGALPPTTRAISRSSSTSSVANSRSRRSRWAGGVRSSARPSARASVPRRRSVPRGRSASPPTRAA